MNEPLTLEQLSEIACLSPYHFHRIFRAEMGESVHDYIKRLRLEDAAFKLKYSENSIDKISFDAGYKRNTSFTKAFKQHFGQSPRNYRTTQQQETVEVTTNTPIARLLTLTDFDVAYVRVKGSYEHAARSAWQSLMSQAYREGLINEGTKAYGITYDSPEITSVSHIRYNVCLRLSDRDALSNELRVQTIQGGPYAIFRHIGAYENLESVYSAIYEKWLPESEKQLRDLPSFCHYHQLDTSAVPVERLTTDVYIPIE